MFFLGILLNLFSSYIIASIIGSGLIIFIAFFALVILNIELLSLLNLINGTNIIILNIFELILLFFLWKNKKFSKLTLKINLTKLKNALILDKSLIILSICFIILIFTTLILAIVMPPLEPDSQTYHFLRAVEFLSQKNLSHFETNDIRALIMPINSEIFYTWIIALKNNFQGCGLLSFFSYILAIYSSFDICSKFKISYRKRLWIIFLFSSLAAIIIQIPSLQPVTNILAESTITISYPLILSVIARRNKCKFFCLIICLSVLRPDITS